MILADKIIAERKKNGWSQEELADKLGVSRQSVSKWEGAQALPDLKKIMVMSQIFGVSTDYLLKDEIEEVSYNMDMVTEPVEHTNTDNTEVRWVSMEEAHDFLDINRKTAPQIAKAVLLCILSPICMIILGVAQEEGYLHISEEAAGGIGMIVLLLIVAIASAVFISCGMKTKKFDYLDKEIIETEYGVIPMVKERKKQYEAEHTRNIIIGTVICIMGVIPIFAAVIFTENEFILACMTSILLFVEGIGVTFFVETGIKQASFEKLLQEGDYSVKVKNRSPLRRTIAIVYWLVVLAIYLGILFIFERPYPGHNYSKDMSWVIWPIAGVLFPAVIAIVDHFEKK